MPAAVLAIVALLVFSPTLVAAKLRVEGSAVVGLIVTEAAQLLQKEGRIDCEVVPQGSSTGGLDALGNGSADMAMVARTLTPEDKARQPRVKFAEVQIGVQVVAFGVAANVWESGVRALTPEQIRGVYEGRIKSWKQLGGPDEPIAFFTWSEGPGVWELFAQWLYGDVRKAPLGRFEPVDSHSAARDTIEFKRGAIAPISPLWLDGKSSFALGVADAAGKPIEPSAENIAAKVYPITRPLVLAVNDRPTGHAKVLIEFLLSEEARPLFKKHGFHSMLDLPKPQ